MAPCTHPDMKRLFCPEGKKRTRSLRSLGLASFLLLYVSCTTAVVLVGCPQGLIDGWYQPRTYTKKTFSRYIHTWYMNMSLPGPHVSVPHAFVDFCKLRTISNARYIRSFQQLPGISYISGARYSTIYMYTAHSSHVEERHMSG